MTLYPRNGFLRKTVYFVCFVLVLIALDMLWVQERRTIHPRYDTTRLVEPTLGDGTVDYLAAIETYFSRGVTPENNAVPLLLEALGRGALPKTQPLDGITSRLGMPHLPEQGDYFVPFADFSKARDGKASDLSEDATDFSKVSTNPPSPVVLAWLAANEKPLAKIDQAVRRTRYFLPFNGGNRPDMIVSILLPHVTLIRGIGHALLARAKMRYAAGDHSGAWDDLRTIHRLTRLLGRAPTLIERAVAGNIELSACNADRQLALRGKFSSRELRAYAADLADMPDLDAPSDAIDMGERLMMLDATQHLAQLTPVEAGRLYRAISNDGAAPAYWLFPFLPIPYEQSMVEINAWYDGLLTAFRQPTYRQRRDAVTRWEKAVSIVSSRSYIGVCSADWAVRLFMPSVERFQTKWETSRAEMRLTRVAMLLAAYKLDHDAFPETLSELAGDDAKLIPNDNFTDRPLIYARAAAGYTLYSVGPNMTDDGGVGDDITANSK